MSKVDDVQEALERGGLTFLTRRRNGADSGYQLLFEGGEIVIVPDSGKILVMGKNIEIVETMLAQDVLQRESPASPAASSQPLPRGGKRRARRARDPQKQSSERPARESLESLSAKELHGVTERVASLRREEIREAVSRLCEGCGERYFELGGVLSRVVAEDWFLEFGYPSFRRWLSAETTLKHAKARYLIQVYDGLVECDLPFEKFKGVGWTKMKVLLAVIRSKKVDDWVKAAKLLSRDSLEAAVKAASGAAKRSKQARARVEQPTGTWLPTLSPSSLEEAAQLLRETYSWLRLNTTSPYEATVIIVEAFESVFGDEAEIRTKAD